MQGDLIMCRYAFFFFLRTTERLLKDTWGKVLNFLWDFLEREQYNEYIAEGYRSTEIFLKNEALILRQTELVRTFLIYH